MEKKALLFERDIKLFIDLFPDFIREKLVEYGHEDDLLEVVLDLGRKVEARYTNETIEISDMVVQSEHILAITQQLPLFDRDNRAGIEGTLHRISAIRNRRGEIIGLTCRVGRAVMGMIDLVKDLFESGKNILLLGKPGIGKTTLLRESARVLSTEFKKRVVVVDTSNEIAGEGNLPHPAVGLSRRMQVPFEKAQYQIMIEAVENHMPEVIIIDEIGTQEEAAASRTIAERGVQLIGTAHGNTLENVLFNPTISDLLGGITSVILSDEESIRRGTQKTVLERTAAPTFDILIEIHTRDEYAVYKDVAKTVDRYLRSHPVYPEIRRKGENGQPSILDSKEMATSQEGTMIPKPLQSEEGEANAWSSIQSKITIRLYPFGVSSTYLSRSLHESKNTIEIVKNLQDATIVLTTESYRKRNSSALHVAESMNIPIYSIPENTLAEVRKFISQLDKQPAKNHDHQIQNLEKLIEQVFFTKSPVNLPPADIKIRKLEHQLALRYGLKSESFGEEPRRFVVVYPPNFMEEKNA
ncbi:MAG: AAA family ATPase [Caldisericia bacterium]|nr:AAA family ATPase [Caldisericia bacterium]